MPKPLQERPDEDLVARSLEGDARAYAALVDRHKNAVYWLVRGLVGRDEAPDVAQEVFVRAFQALPRFRGDSRLDTWLLRIARNRCFTLLRKRGSEPTLDDLGSHAAETLRSPPGHVPDRRLEDAEFAARVRRAVDTLDPPYRTLVALYHFEGLSYERIADVLAMPMGTVKSYLHRARARLREIVLADDVLARHARELMSSELEGTVE